MALHRNHPHQDAIHVTGWISLFTLHILWPFLWVWATLYREDRGWGFGEGESPMELVKDLTAEIGVLNDRLAALSE